MSPGQKRVAKERTHTTRVEEPETQPTSRSQARRLAVQRNEQDKGKNVKSELDELLDEIDEVLAENVANAEEFMSNWIQKGGE